jgi:hypothetical protein
MEGKKKGVYYVSAGTAVSGGTFMFLFSFFVAPDVQVFWLALAAVIMSLGANLVAFITIKLLAGWLGLKGDDGIISKENKVYYDHYIIGAFYPITFSLSAFLCEITSLDGPYVLGVFALLFAAYIHHVYKFNKTSTYPEDMKSESVG